MRDLAKSSQANCTCWQLWRATQPIRAYTATHLVKKVYRPILVR